MSDADDQYNSEMTLDSESMPTPEGVTTAEITAIKGTGQQTVFLVPLSSGVFTASTGGWDNGHLKLCRSSFRGRAFEGVGPATPCESSACTIPASFL
nr:unnamed protein product [Spirometra erinaceieuropaei]